VTEHAEDTYQCDAEFLMLSYPRSGSTWLRYCIEFITERPTFFRVAGTDHIRVTKHIDTPFFEEFLSHEPIVLKRHEWNSKEAKVLKAYNKIILLIRNYKEVSVRAGQRGQPVRCPTVPPVSQSYIDLIEAYHNHEGEKTIIYYEDLLLTPKETLDSLMKWMQVPKNYKHKLEQLMDKFDEHKDKCGKKYRSMSPNGDYKTNTICNKDIYFHTRCISKDALKLVDEDVEKRCPYLFTLYLKRYKGQHSP